MNWAKKLIFSVIFRGFSFTPSYAQLVKPHIWSNICEVIEFQMFLQ